MFKRPPRSRRRTPERSTGRHILLGTAGCLLVALGFFGVWYITRLPSVTLSNLSVTGGETIEQSQIKAEVNAALEGEYLNLIPHRFFLTYPHDKVAAALMSIDRIEETNVKRVGRNNLEVSFHEYKPFALWCLSLEDKSPCYFLDSEGYAFGASPLLQGGALTRHILEGEEALEEKQVFDTERFKKMDAFLHALQSELALRVTHVYYTKEGDVTLNINGGGKVLMQNEGDYDIAFKNLQSVLESPSFKHIKPGNFQYIDIRFGNKIFVNETPEEVTDEKTDENVSELGE